MSLDDKLKQEIISSISTEGAASEENKTVNVVIASRFNIGGVINYASGLPRVKPNITFSLILSQPDALKGLTPLVIRCCLCGRIVSYPAWYYHARYAVNHFHYFICFNRNSPDKPSTACYRKG